MELLPSKEEGVGIIKALCGLGRFISNVNIPNESLVIPNLPKEAVVEVNAVLDKDCIYPIMAGPLPESVRKLVLPHAKNHSLIVRAALETDFEAALAALMRDPNTGSKISAEQGREMLKEMIRDTKAYLPAGW